MYSQTVKVFKLNNQKNTETNLYTLLPLVPSLIGLAFGNKRTPFIIIMSCTKYPHISVYLVHIIINTSLGMLSIFQRV